MTGFVILGVAASNIDSIYKVYFVSGFNQYNTKSTLLVNHKYKKEDTNINIYINDSAMNCSIQNLSEVNARGWIIYIGI